jgi:DNA replication and repair protein RecF
MDAAGDRRAFFDRLVAHLDARHAGHVARLSKLLSERAFALKTGADNNWLNAIETQIAGLAVSVAAARLKYAGEINYFLDSVTVTVTGTIENMLLNNPALDVEKEYLKYLGENRTLNNEKMIIDGAHKSDFGVFNKTLNLPAAVTSTGQQKAVLIDLILAHAKLIKAKTGKTPIVLLDEAAVYLDANARARMFAELAAAGAQVWATGIDADVFADIPNAVFVACKNGTISV